ncbi:DUF4079 domain-containing protein [Spirulina major CS-329]|jgi:hypothetical protein|nr:MULTISPECIES: DUF4079 domain-containing protein [Spirulina]MDB9504675.1 DUF4079 domain-containing protein [Spirulina major CS-329]
MMSFELPESVKVYSQFFHPILMWVLLGLSIYAFYLGSQSRKLRKADKEVRKEMIGKNFTERHFRTGSIVLALMICGTVGGMAVTYINNGKLFVGPHLIAGLGMTAMIAVSASLVPFMQKGNNLARITHISLNIFLLGLFGWQAFSGMDIVTRILSNF